MAKTLKPVNQKSLYQSFASVYEKLMNDEIPVEKAEVAVQALAGMNRTYALELKRAEIEQTDAKVVHVRTLELEDKNQ